MAKKPLEIDMCAGSQLRDTQGEMLSVEGADISELETGKGRFNDNHGKGFFNSIGRVTAAKKIFKAEDCDDERQKYYWDKVKAPYLYVRGFMYDDEDHPNAKAAAAILRNIHKSDVPLKLKASVEGGVIARGVKDPTLLARTKIHSVALTFSPANTATLVEPLNLNKSQFDEAADMQLIKSVIHLAETDVPSFRHIVRDASASKVISNMEKIAGLMKGDNLDIPTKQEIIKYTLESKIQSNISKIHSLVDAAKKEEFEKGWKEAATGAAMLGSAALAPQAQAHPAMPMSRPSPAPASTYAATSIDGHLTNMPQSHQDYYKKVAQRNPILGAVGQVESSGGINYLHKPINDKTSMHHGHTAGGMFGMMPVAAQYILKNDPKLSTKYPEMAEAAKDLKANHGKFTTLFNNNPEAASDFAEALMSRIKGKTKNDAMVFHAWNHGLKGTWNKLKDHGMKAVENTDYVQKAASALDKIKNNRQPAATKAPLKPIAKALTAGYGGAGAPTGNSGGGVLQSEALDDGRKGFKHITCDNCGKEQIYAKFQVKCRDCGKSWSLDKLHKIMHSKSG